MEKDNWFKNTLNVMLDPSTKEEHATLLIDKIKDYDNKIVSVGLSGGERGCYEYVTIIRKAVTNMSSTTNFHSAIILDDDNIDDTVEGLIEFMDTNMC